MQTCKLIPDSRIGRTSEEAAPEIKRHLTEHNSPLESSMRIRRLAHSFLVGGLIVNVRSAKNCSVCGDGYHVGSPTTMTSVRCSVLSDSLCTCSQLQLAGLLGLIANEKCFNISLLIFETCDCQENTALNANDSQYQTSPPVAAPIAAPHHPSLFGPVAAPSFYPTPVAFRPTTYAPVPNAEPTLIDSLGFQLQLAIWAIALLACCWFCCQGCIESICSNCCIGRSRDQISRAESRRNIQEMQQSMPPPPLTRPMSSYRMALGRRPLVLAALFPNEARVSMAGATSFSGCVCFSFPM